MDNIGNYGYRPSKPDSRDFNIRKFVPRGIVLPKKFFIKYPSSVKDQGQVGKCVGESASYCRERKEFEQSGLFRLFSEDFVYACREESDWQGQGMEPREMLKNLQKYGIVSRDDFSFPELEYDELKIEFQKKKAELLRKAEPHRITGYAKLNSVDEIKEALYTLGPVTFGFDVYMSFNFVGSDGIVSIPNIETEPYFGGHEMTLLGWDDEKQMFYGINSWSSKWGDNGYFWMPYNFPMTEAWSMTDTLKPNPSDNPQYFCVVIDKPFFLQGNAEHFAKTVVEKGFKTYIMKLGWFIFKVYKIQIGAYVYEEEAYAALDELTKAGFKGRIIIK